jgi:hypothetical protein
MEVFIMDYLPGQTIPIDPPLNIQYVEALERVKMIKNQIQTQANSIVHCAICPENPALIILSVENLHIRVSSHTYPMIINELKRIFE